MSLRDTITAALCEAHEAGWLRGGDKDSFSVAETANAVLAAIGADRPTREERVNVQTVAAYECGFEAGKAAERERLAKLADGMDIPTGMSGRAVCTVPGKPIADWIRSQGNEDG